MATKKKGNNNKAWEIGAGITAAAIAAAAGAYMLADKKTKAKTKAWVSKAKVEIAKHAKHAKKLGEREYDAIVDQVTKKYGSIENITADDIMKVAKDLKSQWDQIQKRAATLSQSVKKMTAKKKPAVKKAATHKSKPAAKKSRI